MGWNYRVMKHADKNKNGEVDIWYGIHEVYYKNDEIDDLSINETEVGYTVEPIKIIGENIEGLKWMLEEMIKSLEKPILEYKNDDDPEHQPKHGD